MNVPSISHIIQKIYIVYNLIGGKWSLPPQSLLNRSERGKTKNCWIPKVQLCFSWGITIKRLSQGTKEKVGSSTTSEEVPLPFLELSSVLLSLLCIHSTPGIPCARLACTIFPVAPSSMPKVLIRLAGPSPDWTLRQQPAAGSEKCHWPRNSKLIFITQPPGQGKQRRVGTEKKSKGGKKSLQINAPSRPTNLW